MTMYVILLSIIMIAVKADSDEKYIDLLPDEEKEEFIQSVARRILENVKTKEVVHKSSVELFDEDLNTHEAFIKQVLREESSNIRRSRIDKVESAEDLKVKPLRDDAGLDRDAHLDLTVRSARVKRRQMGDISQIPVEVITEIIEVTSKKYDKDNNDQYVSSKEDIQVRIDKKLKTVNFGEKIINTSTSDFTKKVVEKRVNNSSENYSIPLTDVQLNVVGGKEVTDTYNDNLKVNNITGRAILNNSNLTVDTTIHSNPSDSKTNDSMNLENKANNIDDFEVKINKSYSEETTEHLTLDITDITNLITTTDERNIEIKTEGKESNENNQHTRAIYESTPNSPIETDGAEIVANTTVQKNVEMVDTQVVAAPSNKNKRYVDDIDIGAVLIDSRSNTTLEGERVPQTLESIHINKFTNDLDIDDDNNKNYSSVIDALKAMVPDSDANLESVIPLSTVTEHPNSVTTETVRHIIENTTILPNATTLDDMNEKTLAKNNESNSRNKETLLKEIIFSPRTDINDKVLDTITSDANITVHNKTDITVEIAVPSLVFKVKLDKQNHTYQVAEKDIDRVENKTIFRINGLKLVIEKDKINNIPTLPSTEIKTHTTFNEENGINNESTKNHSKKAVKFVLGHDNVSLTSNNLTSNKTNEILENGDKIKSIEPKNNTVIDQPSKPNKVSEMVSEKALNILREGLLVLKEDDRENNLFKKLQTKTKTQSILNKEYHVYEIPADKPPFIKGAELVTEQPYYVPVYNYSPNKAYFNAQNRLGPNADDVQGDDIQDFENLKENGMILREGNTGHSLITFNDDDDDDKRKKFSEASQGKTPQKSFIVYDKNYSLIERPEFKSGLNSKDYEDIEYVTRMGVVDDPKQEDSVLNKEDPYNSMKENNLKDNLSAVRSILFENKVFGYEGGEKLEGVTESPVLIDRKPSLRSDITYDYYYGRMKPVHDQNYYTDVGYFKTTNDTKNLYMDGRYFNDDLLKNIKALKYKDKKFVNENLVTAEPHSGLKAAIKRQRTEAKLKDDRKYDDILKAIGKVLKVTNDKDAVEVFDKLQRTDGSVNRGPNEIVNIHMNVLKDMAHVDSTALVKYDWLGTTLDVRSAIDKLLGLINAIEFDERVHPSDMKLIKYVVFLHKLSDEVNKSQMFTELLRKKMLLPRNKNKNRKKRILNEKGLLNREWLYLRKEMGSKDHAIDDLNEFLMDLQDSLNDLHEGIKNIAAVTKFSAQNWFKNIKEVYLSDNKSYLTLLLHLSATRLLGLIEESARRGVEADFKQYVRKNKGEVTKSVDEMLFTIRILEEIKRY